MGFSEYVLPILLGIFAGTVARLYMLRIDYRQYPSYPHGYTIHLTMGFIAAALGAVAIPALLETDFVAVTFLGLAAQQFRDIRNIERQSLKEMEATELVPRGEAYIEGIARVFEARNYLAMLIGLLTSAAVQFSPWSAVNLKVLSGGIIGVIAALILNQGMRGLRVGDICTVRAVEIRFDGPLLCVDDVVLMNVGLKEAQKTFLCHGLGAILKPIDDNARETLGNIGQRQAILHDVASLLGTRLDVGEKDFTPIARRDLKTGRIAMVIVPIEPDIEALIETINRVPLLETSRRKPLSSKAGRAAAD